MRMPFGKYRGVRVEDLEPSYCEWLLRRFDGPMGDSLRAELEAVRDRKLEECKRG